MHTNNHSLSLLNISASAHDLRFLSHSNSIMAMMLHMADPFHLFSPLRKRRQLEMYEATLRVLEDEHAYKVFATIPGVAADRVTLTVTDDGLLKVVAKSKTEDRVVLSKTVRLAEDADAQAVKATCIDGILEVTVGKVQPPATIAVAVHAEAPPTVEQRAFVVTKKLPGLAASEVKITLEPRVGRPTNSYQLVIHADSTKGYGEYCYAHSLPEDVMPETATAFCCHGLLHVRVPRREPEVVTVPVRADGSEGEVSGEDD